jgi:serine protease Do
MSLLNYLSRPFRTRFFISGIILGTLALHFCRPETASRESQVVKVFRKVSPAVVSVRAIPAEQPMRENPFYDFPAHPLFYEFFRDFGIELGPDKLKESNLGSGVIIHPEGYILTNGHVIIGAAMVEVQLEGGTRYEAEVIGSDARSDLAVLKIKPEAAGEPAAPAGLTRSYPYLEMGTSGDLMIGEQVIAIGNPFGLGHTLTTGVISSLHRTLQFEDRTYKNLIQTDASINPGNSGGPLLNINGDLVGITTAIYQKARGIGFAIPIDRARRIVDDLIRYGEVQPGWLGMSVQALTPELKASLDMDRPEGVLITKVHEKGPARQAGIEPGQVIEKVEAVEVHDLEGYLEVIREITVNDQVGLSIYTNQGSRNICIKAQAFPMELADELIWNQLGIEIAESPLNRGALISRVNTKSRAGKIGLSAGDIVIKVNQYWIKNPEHLRKVMVKNRQMDSVLLGILRQDVIYYTTMPINFVG